MLNALRAVKELTKAAKSGNPQKIDEWKQKHKEHEKEKGVFRFS
ncbi:hypothetical protein [Staphylospora marina]|nr:hypothetical protein [Staphylospora marina]